MPQHKPLKRSGSATLSPNDRFQNGSRSKKAKVELEPSLPLMTITDVAMQSADSAVIPSPPRDAPPEPPAEEDIPAAPPSPAPQVAVGHTDAMKMATGQTSGNSPSALGPEDTNTQISPIKSGNNGLPVGAAFSDPTVSSESRLVANSSSETWSSTLNVPGKSEVASERIASPFKPSSFARPHTGTPRTPPWSPNIPEAPAPGTVFKGNSPVPGQVSPSAPSITMQDMGSPPRAPTPNPNLTFSFLDYHTPAHSGSNTPLVTNKTFFVRKKGERLDPKDDAAAYERQLIGVTKLDDFIMPTGSDKKEATLGKGTFG
ncbi:hypothetical protein QFC22_000347 [Naganishia vaughanmartiniae]|uniref:Uncharacterized protein n=1 Tax=Naganishia vaughanmartiniae TaxID=1424756 RepID=A0ACC2XRR3_9TREE|nr:hypothetical protein QFC22_000347 [Naganishia vaughanmartiniae]